MLNYDELKDIFKDIVLIESETDIPVEVYKIIC